MSSVVTEARTELLEYDYLKVVSAFMEPISEITGRVPTEREYRDLWKSDCIEEFMFLFPGCQQGPIEEWVQLLWYLQSVALEISLQFSRYDADIVVGYSL